MKKTHGFGQWHTHLERLKTKYVPSVSECVPTICGPKKANDLLVSQMHHSGVFDRDEQMSMPYLMLPKFIAPLEETAVQNHKSVSGSSGSQFQLKAEVFQGGFYFISEFFCGWERETWAPTGNSWRAPETSAFRFATWIPIMLPSFSSKIWQRTQGATLQNGWSAAHSLPCWQDVSVCCLSADGNERQAANSHGVPQRHPFTMMTSMKP